MANKEIRILHLEDSKADSELVLRQLKKSEWHIAYDLAEGKDDFIAALNKFSPDVILSDHRLPQFDSMAALNIAKEMLPEIPFILVTGTVSEEYAVSTIKNGADDYILKTNLSRLNLAIENALKKKETEKQVKKMEEQNRLLLETMNEGVIYCDNDYIVLYVNDRFCKLLGYTKDELIGKRSCDIIFDEDAKKKIEEMNRNGKIAARNSFEMELRKKNGEKIWLDINSSPVYDDSGNIIGSMATYTDISELKKTTMELQYKIRELEIFLYRTSHDLRGPLASLLGLSNLVKTEIKDETALDYFRMAEQCAVRLDNILLDLSEIINIKQGQIKEETIDIEAMVSEILKSLEHLPKYKDLSITVNLKAKTIRSEKRIIRTILQNLIDNAIKYRRNNESRPFIRINSVQHAGHIHIEISDNGQGIPADIQPKVFDMFFRGNEKSQGSGLGLYIVKSAVEKLGGSVTIESKENQGCKTMVVLPEKYKITS